MRVTLKGYIEVPTADRDRVMAQLENHIWLTRAEPGCLKFEVQQRERHQKYSEDSENAETGNDFICFDVEEEFVDRQAYFFHQKRLQGGAWAKATSNAKRSYTVTGLEEE
jgi:(4S)-4-hydroxy-5-phosphonooxypentane-2,3-dione isomerase